MNDYYQDLKCVNYSRKSTEDKDRQVLSIPAQMAWAAERVARLEIKIDETFYEERSAKMPYNRPKFDDMVVKIRKGIINCIICWKLDRLARNPEEAGIILGLLKRGEIKLIITSDGEYRPEDNALISYMNFGMADQYVRDLSKNVKRGLKAKVAAGWRPGPAPIGYLNDLTKEPGDRDVIVDPERFDLVRRVLLSYLSGDFSVRELLAETQKWGLTTRPTKRQGGKHLYTSHLYRILTDPFYYGWFYWVDPDSGQKALMKGSHKPMITEPEYDAIQAKLGRKGKRRPKKHNHLYTGKMVCECGSAITAEEKYQLICPKCKKKFAYLNKDVCPGCGIKIEEMKKPTLLHYTYYHCTRRKNPDCKQKGMQVGNVETLIDKALEGFHLSDVFSEWALEALAEDTNYQIQSQNAVINSQQQRYKDVVAELQNLTKLYTSPKNIDGSLMSIEEYGSDRKRLMVEKKQLEKDQETTARKIEEWIDWATNSFDFAVAARVWFENGKPEEKRDIFLSLSGSNLTLKDKELTVSLKKPLDFYSIIATRYPKTKIPLEPRNNAMVTGGKLPFEADIPSLLASKDFRLSIKFHPSHLSPHPSPK
jgi:DNA invertase Pin-like site-specific DNA recombinase